MRMSELLAERVIVAIPTGVRWKFYVHACTCGCVFHTNLQEAQACFANSNKQELN